MRKLWLRLVSIPKTVYVNCRYFPIRIAILFPVFVRYNASVKIKGRINIASPIERGMIHIGFNEHANCNVNDKTSFFIERGGLLTIKGRLFLGNGSKLCIRSGGSLVSGDYVRSTGSTSIECNKLITIGDNVLFSWDCLVMDSDSHHIYSPEGLLMNEDKPIRIGSDVWVGCRSVILKGSTVPSNTIIASCSVVNRDDYKENSIIAGVPAKSVRDIGRWEP